jgi:pilus assembly protein CpaB
VGIFLAIVAFVGILLLQGPSTSGTPEVPTSADTVIAATDLPLGTRVTAVQVRSENLPLTARDADAFESPTQVIGKVVREPVTTGAAITARTFGAEGGGTIFNIDVPPTRRAITVQVDQVTGVGTVIKTGDYVDMVVGFQADKFPVITTNPVDESFTVVAGLNGTSVKLLLQGMQVLGTLLPPPPAQDPNAPAAEPGTALTGQQEIVALSVTAQQAEVIKFAQLDGSISLVLRSAEDFIDPATNKPYEISPLPDPTTGVILKTLVDTYGVLPPELIETVVPALAAGN